MPPSRTFSPEELFELLRKAADAQLTLAAAVNRHATATERLLPSFTQIQHDLSDFRDKNELGDAKLDLLLGRVSTDLALILDNVRHAQTDVRELQRDVTGAFQLEKQSTAERVIGQFEKLSVSTKIIIAILVVIAGLSGWLTHWLAG